MLPPLILLSLPSVLVVRPLHSIGDRAVAAFIHSAKTMGRACRWSDGRPAGLNDAEGATDAKVVRECVGEENSDSFCDVVVPFAKEKE